MNTAKKSSSKDKKMGTCINAQSLEILGLSTQKATPKHIREWLTSLQEVRPAKRSQARDYVKLKTMKEICGQQRKTPFASFNQDFSFLKTYRTCSIFPTLTPYSEACPSSGMISGGVLYQQKMWEHSIKGTDYGFLVREPVVPTISSCSGFRIGSTVNCYIKRLLNVYDLETSTRLIANPQITNPVVFEFVMGWPLNWTSLNPLKKILIPKWTINNMRKIEPIKSVKNQKQRIAAVGNGQVPLCVYSLLKLWLEDIL